MSHDLRDRLRIILSQPRNPLNIGAAARAMSNFGFSRLHVVNPYEVAYLEARSAVNASAVLHASRQHKDLSDAAADCLLVVGTASPGHRTLRHTMRRLETGGPMIRSALERGNVGLVFGSEKFGMSNDEMSRCHWLMNIPTREEHESMNLGQAVAVCLYEIVRADFAAPVPKRPRRLATGEEVGRVEGLLLEVMRECGFLNPVTHRSTAHKVRRMLHRLDLTAVDVPMWLGLLRQILWRFQRGKPAGG